MFSNFQHEVLWSYRHVYNGYLDHKWVWGLRLCDGRVYHFYQKLHRLTSILHWYCITFADFGIMKIPCDSLNTPFKLGEHSESEELKLWMSFPFLDLSSGATILEVISRYCIYENSCFMLSRFRFDSEWNDLNRSKVGCLI